MEKMKNFSEQFLKDEMDRMNMLLYGDQEEEETHQNEVEGPACILGWVYGWGGV